MENNSKTVQSLLSRTFTKKEALAREQFIKIENSDVPANEVSIKNAINKAIAEMEEELDSYARTRKK